MHVLIFTKVCKILQNFVNVYKMFICFVGHGHDHGPSTPGGRPFRGRGAEMISLSASRTGYGTPEQASPRYKKGE